VCSATIRARLAYVERLGQATGRPHDVATKSQAGQAVLGLQPVQEAQRELARIVGVAGGAVELRPVGQGDVARVGPGHEVLACGDAAERPQLAVTVLVIAIEAERGRIAAGIGLQAPIDAGARPGVGRSPRLVRAPALVARRSRDGVVLAGSMVERTAPHRRLDRVRARTDRCVRLTGHGLRLDPGDVLAAGQREQLARLGGVDHPVGLHGDGTLGADEGDRLHAITLHRGGDRRVRQQARDWSQHRLEDREGRARLATQRADSAAAGIEVGPLAAARRASG
jgi:hypothetical protein